MPQMPSKDYAYKTVDALQILVTIHYREDDDQPDKRPVGTCYIAKL